MNIKIEIGKPYTYLKTHIHVHSATSAKEQYCKELSPAWIEEILHLFSKCAT